MTITMYGTGWCGDCKRAKQFFGEQRVHYDFVDVESDPAAKAKVDGLNDGKTIIPTIVFEDGSILVEPSNAELAAKLGVQTSASRGLLRPDRHRVRARRAHGVVVRGPRGHRHVGHRARRGRRPGGHHRAPRQLPRLPRGRDRGASSPTGCKAQAKRFGVEILAATEVVAIEQDDMYRVRAHRRRHRVPRLRRAAEPSARPTGGWASPARTTSSARASTSAPPATGRSTATST